EEARGERQVRGVARGGDRGARRQGAGGAPVEPAAHGVLRPRGRRGGAGLPGGRDGAHHGGAPRARVARPRARARAEDVRGEGEAAGGAPGVRGEGGEAMEGGREDRGAAEEDRGEGGEEEQRAVQGARVQVPLEVRQG